MRSVSIQNSTNYSIISNLHGNKLQFIAICFQKTWLNENDDASLFHLLWYNMIHKGKVCCGHGGLLIYRNTDFYFKMRSDLYQYSDIWEALFIDITGHCIPTKIALGNIYKPPNNNNNNLNISNLIDDSTPILHVLGTENSYAVLVGDFNVDLLKLNECDTFCDLYDLFTTNGFLPSKDHCACQIFHERLQPN